MMISSFLGDRRCVTWSRVWIDVAERVADLDPIAHLEGAPVGHHVAGDDVGDRR